MKINLESLQKAISDVLAKALMDTPEDGQHVESETGIVKCVDQEQRRALFVVLEPQSGELTTDLHGDTYTVSEVEKACNSFNTHCMKANLYHMANIKDAIIEQSFISLSDFNTEDGRMIKKGTWLQWWFFPEDNEASEVLWKSVKSGEINGVSIGARATFEEI